MSDPTTGRLADYTTLRLGGPAERLVEAADSAAVVECVRAADAAGEPLLVLAGGSNLVVSDAGFAGVALLLRSAGVEVAFDGDDVLATVAAGHVWDDFAAQAAQEGWSGVECLSGIPGSAGATPIQNVGAYGQEISEVFESATVYDRRTGRTSAFGARDCRFSYRNSVFKHDDRYVVLDVRLRLHKSAQSGPIRYAETARALGVAVGETAPLERARQTVLQLRRGKGMVLDADDPDTYSAGSFFLNPVISPSEFDRVRERAGQTPPSWPAGDDVKVSAAWLIARAGFAKGYGRDGVAISSKHTLALTNRGAGTTAALLSLAAEVRDGVAKAFDVTLRPEPTLVGVDW
ncbi:MAG: UDP-N-acetylmuramate dehydrogenase [Stackebrandtia sp.]